jgi:hypothetical protein
LRLKNSDDQPLNELLNLLQSEVMIVSFLLGAEAERDAIKITNPVLNIESYIAFRRKAPRLR